ncbi:MAG: hypothetical protein N3A72_04520 [bacterium]|nr:hypothetical protein [bacterium]
MRYLFLIIAIAGFSLTSYGFWFAVDEMAFGKKSKWKPLTLLVGIVLMIFGLLLYGVPNFFR